MSRPIISVIIPAHNSSATIGTAIDSILNQTYPNLEIIVIDDNSTDDTKKSVEKFIKNNYNIRYFSLPYDDPKRFNKRGRNVNAGYMARNYGLEKVRGEWITFQDADDASLKNRIEAQYLLATRYNALHICLEWQQLTEERMGASFDFEKALANEKDLVITNEKILQLSKKSKGVAMLILGNWQKYVPFEIKTMRILNKLFFGSLDSYPGSGNSPLFKREIITKVLFRPIDERVWPSFTGRGADRDFNFQVAETFKKSISFKLPLYLWRVGRENDLGYNFEKYLLK
jgi:glycosyltransferase involved in cell wall biosynthesis